MDVRQVVPKDAIPSVDDPEFVGDYGGAPEDEIIALTVEDETRGYPVRFLDYHEIVNDTVGDVPVAVTWCPLCGSAIVYDRRLGGRVLEFGVSGKLADDDLVMYDRGTDSEWKQSLGVAIAGPLSGAELDVLPATVMTWEAFRQRYRTAPVLAPPGGVSEAAADGNEPADIDYDRDPYADYFERDGFGLAAHRGEESREWNREDIEPKAVVLGVERGADALGFPRPRVKNAGGIARATVGKTDVLVLLGDGIHAYADPGYDFEAVPDGYHANGAVWDPVTGKSDDGRELDRLPGRRLFAFAWQDDHGMDAFWSP